MLGIIMSKDKVELLFNHLELCNVNPLLNFLQGEQQSHHNLAVWLYIGPT